MSSKDPASSNNLPKPQHTTPAKSMSSLLTDTPNTMSTTHNGTLTHDYTTDIEAPINVAQVDFSQPFRIEIPHDRPAIGMRQLSGPVNINIYPVDQPSAICARAQHLEVEVTLPRPMDSYNTDRRVVHENGYEMLKFWAYKPDHKSPLSPFLLIDNLAEYKFTGLRSLKVVFHGFDLLKTTPVNSVRRLIRGRGGDYPYDPALLPLIKGLAKDRTKTDGQKINTYLDICLASLFCRIKHVAPTIEVQGVDLAAETFIDMALEPGRTVGDWNLN